MNQALKAAEEAVRSLRAELHVLAEVQRAKEQLLHQQLGAVQAFHYALSLEEVAAPADVGTEP